MPRGGANHNAFIIVVRPPGAYPGGGVMKTFHRHSVADGKNYILNSKHNKKAKDQKKDIELTFPCLDFIFSTAFLATFAKGATVTTALASE